MQSTHRGAFDQGLVTEVAVASLLAERTQANIGQFAGEMKKRLISGRTSQRVGEKKRLDEHSRLHVAVGQRVLDTLDEPFHSDGRVVLPALSPQRNTEFLEPVENALFVPCRGRAHDMPFRGMEFCSPRTTPLRENKKL